MYFGIFGNHFKFVKESIGEMKGHPTIGRATDRQGAGDATDWERFEDNASL